MAEQFSLALVGIGVGMLGIAVTIVLVECVVWYVRRYSVSATAEFTPAASECCALCGRCPISASAGSPG